MYKLFVIIMIGVLVTSCKDSKKIEIVETHENGNPKIRKTLKNIDEGTYLFEEFYQSGDLKIVGEMKNGKRFGKWTAYFENGKIWSSGDYINGMRQGFSEIFNSNGALNMSGYYKDNQPDSIWVLYDKAGDTSQVSLYRNGEIVKSYNKSTLAPLRN